jgi:hypothetical protein
LASSLAELRRLWVFVRILHSVLQRVPVEAEFVDQAQVDEESKLQLRFYARQFIDAMSPSNFPATNPEVIRTAIRTRSASLVAGMQNLIEDLQKGRITRVDESAFEVGRNLAVTPGSVVFENELIQLIQYAPQTPEVEKTPLLIVPPCINKYYLLDLGAGNSFVEPHGVKADFHMTINTWTNKPEEIDHTTFLQIIDPGILFMGNEAASENQEDRDWEDDYYKLSTVKLVMANLNIVSNVQFSGLHESIATWLVRENRNLMIGRVRQLERYGLATESEPGRWIVSDRAEQTLKQLGERNEVIKTIHRALANNGLAEEGDAGQFALHGGGSGEKIVGRVLAKGLAGDEMSERVYLVVDGIDGRVHHMEFKDSTRLEEVARDMIVEAAPVVSGPRPADRNIASNAEKDNGIYRPSRHLERVRDSFERQGKDPEAFVRSHARRLEALRRAGLVERIDADHWKVPKDIVQRGQAYDLSQGGDGLRIRTLSAIGLDRQIASDGATWLDRQIIAEDRSEIRDSGFGREVNKAISRRARRLVEMGLATAKDGSVRVPVDTVATLERREIERVGHQMARERGLTYLPANAGEYVSGRLAGVASLVSGRFAMIDNGLGFQLVPWQPLLEKRIGQHIGGLMRDDGGIEWTFGRNRGLSL